ncbi:polysaccharide deacetylase family protein [uncultured Streptomyces sp.]|uniref:polysaccharide deacetylase family protein n=1 Tax=uncultured Streptomyces sp. TaxID=174707 RepID=UPI002611542D|nr:polysaccharide deacetylase family protein [uncultured Streptomyces sp.]
MTSTAHTPPQRSAPHPGAHRAGARAARALLGALAVVVVAVPFQAAWSYDAHRRAVTAQQVPPGPSDAAMATPRAGAPTETRTVAHHAPVVLAYHDVGRGSRSRYTVTPQAFEDQLATLARAGYRSLDSAEFLDFLRSGSTPAPRTVFLTFDDGAHGLWVHADRILAKYRMKAAAFLITGHVSRHRPYYLSWEEIARMEASGRWDFENHTHDLHHRAAVDRSGRRAPALSNPLWLPHESRAETPAEFRARVSGDLDLSLRTFARHGLPRPHLFAYPFSEASDAAARPGAPGADGTAQSVDGLLTDLLRTRFRVRLTNSSERPLPAGRRAATAGQVQRLEVTRATSTADLLAGLARFTTSAPSASPHPLEQPSLWRRTDRGGHTGLGALTGRGPYPGRTGYASAAHMPLASADWTGYTVTTTVDRLSESRNNIGLVVRDHSREPVSVALSDSFVRVLVGIGDGRREIARRALVSGPCHRLSVTVEADRTVVLVDGTVRIERRSPRSATAGNATGGIAFSTRNGDPASSYPRFTSMTVTPLPGHPGTPRADAAR